MHDDRRSALAKDLLISTTRKLIELREVPEWKEQLPARCPPVLWFGNSRSRKRIVVTLAANPSRKEYLRDAAEQALSKVRQAGNDSLLSYLEPPHNRFRLLGPAEQLSDVLESGQLQDEILAGYDDYFERNPYTTWFGSPRERSYNVEGFLRGLGSSYFGRVASDFQAVHIDLFPLATLSDFSNLRALSDRDLLRTTWARTVIQALLDMLQPIALLIFGRANFDAFGSYIDPSVRHFRHVRYGRAHYFAGVAQAFNVRVIGLSTNLGNPMGFSSEPPCAFAQRRMKIW